MTEDEFDEAIMGLIEKGIIHSDDGENYKLTELGEDVRELLEEEDANLVTLH